MGKTKKNWGRFGNVIIQTDERSSFGNLKADKILFKVRTAKNANFSWTRQVQSTGNIYSKTIHQLQIGGAEHRNIKTNKDIPVKAFFVKLIDYFHNFALSQK